MKLHYETDRLCLKILKYDAAPQVLQFYLNNKEIFETYEPERPANFYTENYQRTLLNGEFNLAVKLSTIRFWVYEKEHPETIIGTVCFHGIQRSVFDTCQVGYKFDQRYWRHGYATEALYEGIQIMFDDLKLHRIEAYVMPSNIASQHLLEGLGFVQEGVSRGYVRIKGIWQDHYRYALINE